MKKCPTCNRLYADTDSFCNFCGVTLITDTAVVAQTTNIAAPENKKGLLWWQILIIVATSVALLIAIAFCAVFVINKLNDDDNNSHYVEDDDKDKDDKDSDEDNGEDTDENSDDEDADDNGVNSGIGTTQNNGGSLTPGGQTNNGGSSSGNNGKPALDLSTKEGVLNYYKEAHAKVLSEASSVTRTLDNPSNYNNYLDVGGNSALASVAQVLMSEFLVSNEDPVVYSGSSDIKTYFPPSNNSSQGLTADMISSYNVSDNGSSYVISLTLNSTESNPDNGDKTAHLANIVDAVDVENAAAGFVGFSGLRNEYIAPTVTATIEKSTGRMTALHTVVPSYMKFDKATLMSVINVSNVGIGIQYEQNWTVQY